MLRASLIVAGISLFALPAHATNVAVMVQSPNLLSLAVFVIACAAAVICWQVFSVLKGGYLSRSWQFFVIGFGLLAVSQASNLLTALEIFLVPTWVSPAILALMVAVFFFAAFDSKRVLS